MTWLLRCAIFMLILLAVPLWLLGSLMRRVLCRIPTRNRAGAQRSSDNNRSSIPSA